MEHCSRKADAKQKTTLRIDGKGRGPDDLLSMMITCGDAQDSCANMACLAGMMQKNGTRLCGGGACDPLVDCLDEIGDRTGIPDFYVAFVLAPIVGSIADGASLEAVFFALGGGYFRAIDSAVTKQRKSSCAISWAISSLRSSMGTVTCVKP